MGLIREPEGVDFVVDSRKLNEWEKKEISGIIAHYKITGEIKKISPPKVKKRSEILRNTIKTNQVNS